MNTYHGDTEARSCFGLWSQDLTESIIGAAIEAHRELGPGLLEPVYQDWTCQELRLRNIPFQAQVELPTVYKGRQTGGTCRIDLIVGSEVVVRAEIRGTPVGSASSQLLTYLKLTERGWA
jgi:GxxExxY protein